MVATKVFKCSRQNKTLQIDFGGEWQQQISHTKFRLTLLTHLLFSNCALYINSNYIARKPPCQTHCAQIYQIIWTMSPWSCLVFVLISFNTHSKSNRAFTVNTGIDLMDLHGKKTTDTQSHTHTLSHTEAKTCANAHKSVLHRLRLELEINLSSSRISFRVWFGLWSPLLLLFLVAGPFKKM